MTIREVFENDIALEEDRQLAGARVFTEAGGFAPTVGIIGAVLGLIHVMENLTDTSKLGTGIAVAFVATVYGVGSANILLIPFGNKLKRKILIRSETKAMILEGALGIVNGLNPYLIEQKLKSFGHTTTQKRGA
jgi:chemotaxis protein MotA